MKIVIVIEMFGASVIVIVFELVIDPNAVNTAFKNVIFNNISKSINIYINIFKYNR